jgi:hypothetical protein
LLCSVVDVGRNKECTHCSESARQGCHVSAILSSRVDYYWLANIVSESILWRNANKYITYSLCNSNNNMRLDTRYASVPLWTCCFSTFLLLTLSFSSLVQIYYFQRATHPARQWSIILLRIEVIHVCFFLPFAVGSHWSRCFQSISWRYSVFLTRWRARVRISKNVHQQTARRLFRDILSIITWTYQIIFHTYNYYYIIRSIISLLTKFPSSNIIVVQLH